MFGKIWLCDWRVIAPFALIWLLKVICSDVISELGCIWRCMIALWAFVCEWACAVLGFQQGQMNLHIVHICVISVQCGWSNDLVLPQYSCFTKWLLYFTVDEQMPFKISSLTKLPIALDTGDILFSDMGCHVTIQISSLIKWLLAFWAKMHFSPSIWEQMPRH